MATERLTATKVYNEHCDHITKHKDVYDPRSEKMHKTLYGETGINGLAGMLKAQGNNIDNITAKLSNIESNLTWLNRLIIGAVVMAVLGLVFVK